MIELKEFEVWWVARQHLEDFATMAGLEFLIIENETELAGFKNEIKWNKMYYSLVRGM